jgi:acylphosphatase
MARSISAADIVVEGLVQGVGFRAFAQRRASFLGLVGFVMNRDDGRVMVHAEGDDVAIRELARDLERGPRLARVHRVTVRTIEPSGTYTSFGIRDELTED